MMSIGIYALTVTFVVVTGQSSDNSSLKFGLPTDCGITKLEKAVTARLIDGEKASLGQFPWMVRLGMRRKKRINFFCGGSLISRYYVTTAAHCEKNKGNIARLGENYLDTDKDCEYGRCAVPHQDIKIKKFMSHEKYCTTHKANDYALVELEDPAEYNDFVQPICFPLEQFSYEDLRKEHLTISGWGMTNAKSKEYPKYLLYISVPLLDPKECNKIYKNDLVDSQLCLGVKNSKCSCRGDSGGPVAKIVEANGTRRTHLIGIVSYGRKICAGPDVYTDVAHFTSWTLERLKKH